MTPELHEAALEDFRYSFGQVVPVAEIVEALGALQRAGA